MRNQRDFIVLPILILLNQVPWKWKIYYLQKNRFFRNIYVFIDCRFIGGHCCETTAIFLSLPVRHALSASLVCWRGVPPARKPRNFRRERPLCGRCGSRLATAGQGQQFPLVVGAMRLRLACRSGVPPARIQGERSLFLARSASSANQAIESVVPPARWQLPRMSVCIIVYSCLSVADVDRAGGTPLSDSDNGIFRRMAPATSGNRMRSLRP